MKPQNAFGILMLLLITLLEVSTYPSNSESITSTEEPAVEKNNERSLTYDETNIDTDDTAIDIIKKISAINEALKKPSRRYQIPWNHTPSQINTGNALDKDILEKLQQVIASGKLHSYSNNIRQDNENNKINGNREIMGYSRRISPVAVSNSIAPMSMPYVMNMPVLVMPNANNALGYMSNIDATSQYQTKESPSFSFQPFLQYLPQIQTPFASVFPILFRDPIVSAVTGASFIEYGQSADVCKRQQKSEKYDNESIENEEQENIENLLGKSREKRAVKKRTVSHDTKLQEIEKIKKFFSLTSTTAKPVKQTSNKLKTTDEVTDDLRFNFLFGHKEPIPHPLNGPGFIINRLKVRKGGVAIAGPGGVATAGRGGTAIVGPGGLAYTQPGGVAVAGPAARIIALSSDADLTSVANRLHQQSSVDGSVSRLLEAIPEGKHVATGPIVYVHPNNRFYGVRQWNRDGKRDKHKYTPQQDTYKYNGVDFQEIPLEIDGKTFTVFVKPVAHAKSSKGMAIANPVSQVLIANHGIGTIVHAPVATAVVGPGGIAHAQSDLYIYEYVTKASVHYLPFYGGARGQYLEIKKDNSGKVTGEKIVSEENISSENVVKDKDENLLAKVMAANLQNLKTLSTNLLKLTNLGRKTGSLGNTEKARYKTQLASIGEAASNIIKLIEEIDDVDVLFKKNVAVRSSENEDTDYVGEEGVGIDASSSEELPDGISAGLIADAKPVGIAVVGESGIAASKPMATAVASSGIAIARPIATAIAGFDPGALGLNFETYKKYTSIKD